MHPRKDNNFTLYIENKYHKSFWKSEGLNSSKQMLKKLKSQSREVEKYSHFIWTSGLPSEMKAYKQTFAKADLHNYNGIC